MTAFDRLSPALRYHIVNSLGWPDLRPVQNVTIDAVLDGHNCVVLAPTAGGKTEAAFFPLLSSMDKDDWRPVSAIYLSPIKALLNNQEARIEQYTALLGRKAFKWHGDVSQGQRQKFLRDPADILLTTPESIEAMLMSSKVPARELFSGLQAVIVDEIHAFADDDRGAHLSAVLERLSRFSGRDFQRIGLSATVGNPDEILRWLKGSSQRTGRVVHPKAERKEPELTLDWVGNLDNAAHVIAKLHPGKKRLVFVDSRRKVERLGRKLTELGTDTYLIHGSLAAAERKFSERMFEEGQNCVIVATSAMELGIDVGDLDHVIQIDSPGSVASFLQRMGRTGRRPNTTSNCTFLCTDEAGLLEAAGVVQLFREGFVEPVTPHRRAAHILAHQLMALSIQQGGLPASDAKAWLAGSAAFHELDEDDFDELVEHMISSEILVDQAGLYWLGPEGERQFGKRNFAELYAVFSTPRIIEVRWSGREIGTVDGQFLSTLQENNDRSAFTLGGRPWKVMSVDWRRGVCAVEPAEHALAARWPGSPRFSSFELCQVMRRVLVADEADPAWSERARDSLRETRDEHQFLHDEIAPLTELPGDGVRWWTFAGGRANTLLGRMLETELGGRCVVRNTSIDLRDAAGKSDVAIRQAIRKFAEEGRPNEADERRYADGAVRSQVSKFESCLPPRLLHSLWSRAGLDVHGASHVVTATTTLEERPVPVTKEESEHDVLDGRWVSASKTRNYMLRDPLLDWLNLYGEARGFVRDDKADDYDLRTDFTQFIFAQGNAFEMAVVEHLRSLTDVVKIAQHPRDVRLPDMVQRTLDAMRDGASAIFQGVLHDGESMTYGAPDLMFRSDVLRKFFPDAIEEDEAVVAAPALKGAYHYCIVDVKFTNLSLLKGGELANSGSCRAYKAQLYIYNRALGRLQGYLPPKAYLLGRGWKQGTDRGSSCMERLAPVRYTSNLRKDYSLGQATGEAVEWIRRVRTEGRDWQVLPEPTIHELRPNMSYTQDAPWHGAKSRLGAELEDLTLLWQVGIEKRKDANERGILRWTEREFSAADVGVKGAKQAPILEALLEINRSSDGPPVQPARVTAAEDMWRQPAAFEFYVDFETVSDLDDDFSRIPQKGGQPLIFMIGCGHIEDGKWAFKCFTADALNEDAEAGIIDAWLDHMAGVKGRLSKVPDPPLVFHWSHAEVSTLETAYNSAAARHPAKAWSIPNWFDFLKNVIRTEPVVVRGALAFGLKAIAKAMHGHGLIETNWGDGPTDGLGAMVGAWTAAREAAAAGKKLSDIPLVKEIEAYNEVDCRVMMEIVRYLRTDK
ncbi:DEAD/DEAH box helicase [Myxococcota bacterium]